MIIQCGSAKNIENPAISDNYSCGRREGAGEYAESPKIRGFYKKTSDNQNYQKCFSAIPYNFFEKIF